MTREIERQLRASGFKDSGRHSGKTVKVVPFAPVVGHMYTFQLLFQQYYSFYYFLSGSKVNL